MAYHVRSESATRSAFAVPSGGEGRHRPAESSTRGVAGIAVSASRFADQRQLPPAADRLANRDVRDLFEARNDRMSASWTRHIHRISRPPERAAAMIASIGKIASPAQGVIECTVRAFLPGAYDAVRWGRPLHRTLVLSCRGLPSSDGRHYRDLVASATSPD